MTRGETGWSSSPDTTRQQAAEISLVTGSAGVLASLRCGRAQQLGYARAVGIGSGLARLKGYPFEVRYSAGALARARVTADVAAAAYTYFDRLFPGVRPDIALIVADQTDWLSRQPYGLAFFNDDPDEAPQLRVVSVSLAAAGSRGVPD